MSWLNAAFGSIYGAYRLARADETGHRYFDVSPAGFWHSFTAAIVVLPLYLALMIARFTVTGEGVSGFNFLVVQSIAYVISWTAFPVVMDPLVKLMDRDGRYIRLIVAYNWATVLQHALYIPLTVLAIAGVPLANVLAFFALVAVLIYSWYVVRTSLNITSGMAASVVALDLFISIVTGVWSESLL